MILLQIHLFFLKEADPMIKNSGINFLYEIRVCDGYQRIRFGLMLMVSEMQNIFLDTCFSAGRINKEAAQS